MSKFISLFIGKAQLLHYVIKHKPSLLEIIVRDYYKLRSLLIQRSKFIDDSLAIIKDIILLLSSPQMQVEDTSKSSSESSSDENTESEPSEKILLKNVEGPKIMISTTVKSIEIFPEIVIREAHKIIFPEKPVADVPIIMPKYEHQEDFIPGHLPSDITMSHSIGNTFRDIKNKVCTILGMTSLIEDDHSMELLVNNNLISLDLPIDGVYNKVWIPAEGDTPMQVICRLQGLEGEATEPFISSIPSEEQDELPPEEKFVYTSSLIPDNGFKPLLDCLDIAEHPLPSKSLVDLLDIINAFAKVKDNCREISRLQGFAKVFNVISNILSQIPDDQETSKATETSEKPPTSEKSHQNDDHSKVDSLLNGALRLANTLLPDSAFDNDPESRINFIFSALQHSYIRSHTEFVPFLLSLLPVLASRSAELTETALRLFLQNFPPSATNIFESSSSLFMLEGFAEFCLALPADVSSNTIRDKILSQRFVGDALNFLTSHTDITTNYDSLPTLPALLKILTGTVRGHSPTQQLLKPELITLLFDLSRVLSSHSIGELAEALLNSASAPPSICASIIEEEKQRRIRLAKESAARKREAVLKSSLPISSALAEMMDALEDEKISCCICKEGYSSQPRELLGIYTNHYCDSSVPTTVSMLTFVHPSCHTLASKASSSGKNKLSEWEAAMVRNCEHPTNSIFPLPNKGISQKTFMQAVMNVLDLARNSGYSDALIQDVGMHIKRIGLKEKIELSDGGGSTEDLVALLPLLLYAGELFIDDGDERRKMEDRLGKDVRALKENIDANVDLEDIMNKALFLMSPEEWNCIKEDVFRALIRKNGKEENGKLIGVLVMFAVYNRAQILIKGETGEKKEGCGPNKEAKWLKDFEEKMETKLEEIFDEWCDFGGEVQDEIMEVEDLKTAFIYCRMESQNPEEFVQQILQ